MKLRRLAALVSATVLALGMVTAVSATTDKVTICHASGLDGTTKFETLNISVNAVYGPGGHFNENGTPQAGHEQDYLGPCKADEPSSEPSHDASEEPSHDASEEPSQEASEEPSQEPECENEQGQPIECASVEPSQEASDEPSSEPSDEASVEPSEDASVEPSEEASDGQVEGLTSEPTLPPTDALATDSTNGPDGTLPLVLIVLGVIGLSAVVLTPVRTKR
jgi:hypothetical protein